MHEVKKLKSGAEHRPNIYQLWSDMSRGGSQLDYYQYHLSPVRDNISRGIVLYPPKAMTSHSLVSLYYQLSSCSHKD